MFHSELFLFQLALIVGFSRLVAWAFGKIGQPQVVGEMAAGIALGPTLFGFLAPGAWHAVFPAESLGYLNALSQAGLVIFIFLIGVRVDFEELREQSRITFFSSTANVLAAWAGTGARTAGCSSATLPVATRRHSRYSSAPP